MPTVRLSDDVVFRSFGEETVLLNLKTGHYHGIKGSGGRMLEVLTETGDMDAAARKIAAEYDHPLDQVSSDLTELCSALKERSLIEIDDDRTDS